MPKKPHTAVFFNNGRIAAFDRSGEQIPELQGQGTTELVARINTANPSINWEFRVSDEDVERFESGAVRSTDSNDVRYDLIPPEALRRLAERFARGSKKYGDDNWKKGFPIGNILNHLQNHLEKWKLEGCLTDDNLGAAMWGIVALMWYEKHKPELLKEYGVPTE
jgi:hypothetical protein